MKKFLPVLFLILAVCAGCTSRYNLILNNGDVLSARGKPRYDKETGRYYFTDGTGQPASISSSRVREVGPASMSVNSSPNFLKQ